MHSAAIVKVWVTCLLRIISSSRSVCNLGVATLAMIRQGDRYWIGLKYRDMEYGARRG